MQLMSPPGSPPNSLARSDVITPGAAAGQKRRGIPINADVRKSAMACVEQSGLTPDARGEVLSCAEPSDPMEEATIENAGAEDLPLARYPLTVQMEASYVGEEMGSVWPSRVVYLDPQRRKAYKLTMRDGKLCDANGESFDTADATKTTWNGEKENTYKAIFVMDTDGNFYAFKHRVAGEFQHSSFLAGGEVAAAGLIKVDDGEVLWISPKSGHYLPTRRHLDQAIDCLKLQGFGDFEIGDVLEREMKDSGSEDAEGKPDPVEACVGGKRHEYDDGISSLTRNVPNLIAGLHASESAIDGGPGPHD
jgi:hypothetical protein